jgi:hypothetical protein
MKVRRRTTGMKYLYTLPETLEKLVAAPDDPDVKRLYRLAHSQGMYQAVCDWQQEGGWGDSMEAAKEACKALLGQETEKDTIVTNSPESFSMLFLQTFYGAYEGLVEIAERSPDDMLALVRLVRDRTEAEAIALLDEMSVLASKQSSNGSTQTVIEIDF